VRNRTEPDCVLAECSKRKKQARKDKNAMRFEDRTDAGRKLAEKLAHYANRPDVVVLGIPRGGVAVGAEVAAKLSVPLDVFLLRKLGVPGFEELAFGAIASGGVCILDHDMIDALDMSEQDIEQVLSAELKELKRREVAYRSNRPLPDLREKTVIVVDDGIATGASMRTGIQALRQLQPKKVVVAVPVAPQRTCVLLKSEVDELVCVQTPPFFHAIGQFYEDFEQVSDEEVLAVLEWADRTALKNAV
jgi:putative phosphoribosyl transferase